MVRIDGATRLGSIAKPKGASKTSPGSSTSPGDGEKVSVADASALREKAQAMMADMPEVRLERIEEIRDALESGKFSFSSQKVATQIVRNALAEHSWK
ncbi:MAG: flagellar biosynthesis anti-sigma factor FlgM [Mariprofundus sp.]